MAQTLKYINDGKKETEQYNMQYYPTHIDVTCHQEDPNLHIYPMGGKHRTEYLLMDLKDKEPQTTAQEKKKITTGKLRVKYSP